MFRIGQRVVCVNDRWITLNGENVPRAKKIYTVRSINAGCVNQESTYIRLIEVRNPPIQYANAYCEAAFDVEGFRPLIEKKTDISIFTKLLNNVPLHERETVGDRN